MNFDKPEKSEFWKNEKEIAGDIITLYISTKSHDHMRYSSCDTELERNFFVILLFYPPPPQSPNDPKNHNFEKMKKASGDLIILNLCNKKHDHMVYAYSDMECDRHNFLLF